MQYPKTNCESAGERLFLLITGEVSIQVVSAGSSVSSAKTKSRSAFSARRISEQYLHLLYFAVPVICLE